MTSHFCLAYVFLLICPKTRKTSLWLIIVFPLFLRQIFTWCFQTIVSFSVFDSMWSIRLLSVIIASNSDLLHQACNNNIFWLRNGRAVRLELHANIEYHHEDSVNDRNKSLSLSLSHMTNAWVLIGLKTTQILRCILTFPTSINS